MEKKIETNKENQTRDSIFTKFREINLEKGNNTNCHKSVLFALGLISEGDLYDMSVSFPIQLSNEENYRNYPSEQEFEIELKKVLLKNKIAVVQIEDEPYYIRHSAFATLDENGEIIFSEVPDYGTQKKETTLRELYNRQANNFDTNTLVTSIGKYGDYKWAIIPVEDLLNTENKIEIVEAIKSEKRNRL